MDSNTSASHKRSNHRRRPQESVCQLKDQPKMNRKTESPITEGSTIAVMLHNFMVRGGYTETETASLLGCDQAQVGRWRRGVTTPRAVNLRALSELLGVSADVIEAAREESERVRAEVAARKVGGSPEVNLAKIQAELKAKDARIKRLEMQLAEALKNKSTLP